MPLASRHEVTLSPAPRIDVLRKQLSSTKDLLDQARKILDALHELAYSRPAAAERLGVSESQPEGYYLDTHGDMRARSAYVALAREVDAACQQIKGASRRALDSVSAGDVSGDDKRAPVSIEVLDHLNALDAQTRRHSRGELDVGRTITQPKRTNADRTAARKIRTLETQLRNRERSDNRKIRTLEAKERRLERSIETRDRRIVALQQELALLRGDAPAAST
jgi:hypothetical protein